MTILGAPKLYNQNPLSNSPEKVLDRSSYSPGVVLQLPKLDRSSPGPIAKFFSPHFPPSLPQLTKRVTGVSSSPYPTKTTTRTMEMMMKRVPVPPPPCHYAFASFTPRLSSSCLVKPLSNTCSGQWKWRPTTPIGCRRAPVVVRLSALDTPAEPPSELKTKAAELLDELKGTSLFLVGMKCAMKTHIGRRIADALRYYYFDSDSLVEEAYGGETAAKVALESDEQGFKESQTEVLRQLSAMGRLVVCAGDCAVQSSTNLALLRDGISIWIDIPLDVLAKESRQTVTNPDLFSEVLAALSVRYNEFREGYATADATVSLQRVAAQQAYGCLDSVTIEEMAIETLKQVEKLIKVRKMMQAAAKPF